MNVSMILKQVKLCDKLKFYEVYYTIKIEEFFRKTDYNALLITNHTLLPIFFRDGKIVCLANASYGKYFHIETLKIKGFTKEEIEAIATHEYFHNIIESSDAIEILTYLGGEWLSCGSTTYINILDEIIIEEHAILELGNNKKYLKSARIKELEFLKRLEEEIKKCKVYPSIDEIINAIQLRKRVIEEGYLLAHMIIRRE